MVIIAFLLNEQKPTHNGLSLREKLAKLDLLGELFLLPCIVCLLLSLQWGGTTYSWSNGRIIALLVVFGVMLAGFVLSQVLRPNTATISVRIAKNRDISAACAFAFCSQSSMLLVL